MIFNGYVLVDFYSDCCMPCKRLACDLEDLKEKWKTQYNLDILKLSIEEHYELAEKYAIMSVPTLILFKDNIPTKSFVGYRNKEQLLKFVEET